MKGSVETFEEGAGGGGCWWCAEWLRGEMRLKEVGLLRHPFI